MMKAIHKLTLVTTSLGYADGGAASLSRLVAQSTAAYCREKALDFEVLNLGKPTDILEGTHVKHFSQNQRALALAVWQRAFIERRTAFIFMHVGLARTMALVPGLVRPSYLLWLLGVEVWKSFHWQQRKAMENATLRLAISAFTKERAHKIHSWLPPTQVFPLALEERPVTGELDKDLIQEVGENFILIVGRLDAFQRHKGHDDLIKAMPRVVQAVPQAKLVVIGDGDDLPRLQALASSLDSQAHIFFTGFVNERTRDELYRRCQVFAMPSRNDGFGLVYLEAMKAHKPCVALYRSSGAEIIQDNETGLLVDHDNQQQLENALIRLLTDEAFCKRLGEAGYKRWQQYFIYESFQERFQALLDQMCRDIR